jgi:SAM-dependent methyltransferase
MADQYPGASVTGVDLSPIQPEFVPPNCSFEVDDINDDWTYPNDHFDFIHIRELFGSITNWDKLLADVYRCTRPGGWVEIVERSIEAYADNRPIPPDHVYHEMNRVAVQMSEETGKSFTIWKEAKSRLLAAGFVDVVESRFKWPINDWSDDPKWQEIGNFNQARLHLGLEGYMVRLLTLVLEVSE